MHQSLAILTFDTEGQGLLEITEDVASWLRATDVRMGVVTLFCQHTSASLLVSENAAPAVKRDLMRWLGAAVPEGDGYEHRSEGPDDMPAHIKAALTAVSLAVPIRAGRLALGQWQGIYLFEHRHGTHERNIVAHVGA